MFGLIHLAFNGFFLALNAVWLCITLAFGSFRAILALTPIIMVVGGGAIAANYLGLL